MNSATVKRKRDSSSDVMSSQSRIVANVPSDPLRWCSQRRCVHGRFTSFAFTRPMHASRSGLEVQASIYIKQYFCSATN